MVYDNTVICSACGSEMKPWHYVAFPSRRRHIMWRCDHESDHITAMLPLPEEQ